MSAPAKTSDEQIRLVARRLLEAEGLESLSMQKVADEVGVRAPSLYKRFVSRADLLSAITKDALAELKVALDEVSDGPPYESLVHMARMYRAFARKNPRVYELMFAGDPGLPRDDADLKARLSSAATLLRILSGCLGEEKALPGARTLVAFLHGFLTMELTGLFRFGGDIDEAFEFGLTTILTALLGDAGKGRSRLSIRK